VLINKQIYGHYFTQQLSVATPGWHIHHVNIAQSVNCMHTQYSNGRRQQIMTVR